MGLLPLDRHGSTMIPVSLHWKIIKMDPMDMKTIQKVIEGLWNIFALFWVNGISSYCNIMNEVLSYGRFFTTYATSSLAMLKCGWGSTKNMNGMSVQGDRFLLIFRAGFWKVSTYTMVSRSYCSLWLSLTPCSVYITEMKSNRLVDSEP